MARLTRLVAMLSSLAVGACTGGVSDDEPVAENANEVTVDTSSAAARRQYDANVAFALGYVPRCAPAASSAALAPGETRRPRVLVTGFGRFMSVGNNATGRIVSALVPEAAYPETSPPIAGEVDPPDAQLSVGTRTLILPAAGEVEVCAMILPVYWDLAAILVASEMEAFRPDLVLMNGVAGHRQPLWLELGATNQAAALDDGSNQLRPFVDPTRRHAPIVEDAAESEAARGNLLSWSAVASAAEAAIDRHAGELDEGTRFDASVHGVRLAGYPRTSNTYLCNNLTYVTGYVMDHPGEQVRLLRASVPEPGRPNWVDVRLSGDLSNVPRAFVHWPADLATRHHQAGAEVMRAMVDAQLTALRDGDLPTVGDNADADSTLRGGDFF
jgi:pyrrolidone-carboxylate peptidase